MLNITFEFVGGPNDGKVVQGKLGEPTDAERHYLFSNRGRIGQRFAVASDYAIESLMDKELTANDPIQRHHYVVTDRLEEGDEVWVRAEYVPETSKGTVQRIQQDGSADKTELEGCLLIASPRMIDPLFGQSVVFVLEHDEQDSFGILLNRPTPETVDKLWSEVSEVPCDNQQPVYVGGPEGGPIVVIHTDESAADVSVTPGVFLSVEKDSLESILQKDDVQQRVFVGTIGWDAKQIEAEIANGDWMILPATKDLIFAESDNQWREAFKEYQRQFLRSIGVKHIPDDPSTN